MSRRAPRYRIDLAAKAQPLLGGETAVCRTKDVSEVGLCLDTSAWFPLGTRISISLYDPSSSTALEVIGDVVREACAPSWTLGLLLIEPPDEWHNIVAAAQRNAIPNEKPAKRLRVLVVGDDHRQRGAMALYVTSGWDVLFATDADIVNEVNDHQIVLDAVIAELDASDPRVSPIMEGIRRLQPGARRIVRGTGTGSSELVHRFVDRNDGLEALLDAITADIPTAP
ncbi:MAG: PilZ domain-containing protein [Kofleriaceae bacterium]|nr:PilZ domain-containing protein [Kofleriaceae bacterium]